MVGVMNLCTSAVFGLLPLYAVDPGPMGLSETGYGIFLTSMALGSVVGGWSARVDGAGARAGPGCCSSRC